VKPRLYISINEAASKEWLQEGSRIVLVDGSANTVSAAGDELSNCHWSWPSFGGRS
jgi:hypothetical protein